MKNSKNDDMGPTDGATSGDRSGDDQQRSGQRNGREREEGGHRRRGGRSCGQRRHQGRKERVLHTRISEQLSEDIRRLADDLRVPTSNLVRNVLEEVFTMVETVSDDVGELFDEVLDEAGGARDRVRRRAQRGRRRSRSSGRRRHFDDDVESELRRDEVTEDPSSDGGSADVGSSAGPEPVEHRERREFPDVIGWQPLVLNRDQKCANCEVDLHRGARAYVGIGEAGMTGTTLCQPCTGAR